MLEQLVVVVLLAIPVSCVAWTVTKEEIFRELRDFCAEFKRENRNGWLGFLCGKLAYLPTCYYCFSHWVTACMMLLYPVKFVGNDWQGYLFAFFAIVLIANIYLTSFNILRAALRWTQAKADLAETRKIKAELAKKRTKRARRRPSFFNN